MSMAKRVFVRVVLLIVGVFFIFHPDTREWWGKWWRMGGF